MSAMRGSSMPDIFYMDVQAAALTYHIVLLITEVG